jgi:hypothetical protein
MQIIGASLRIPVALLEEAAYSLYHEGHRRHRGSLRKQLFFPFVNKKSFEGGFVSFVPSVVKSF